MRASAFTGTLLVVLAFSVLAPSSTHAIVNDTVVLGDELSPSEFLAEVQIKLVLHVLDVPKAIDGCASLTAASEGYHFEGGQASGLSQDRCTTGGTCQCKSFSDSCDSGDCYKVYRCNDTAADGCFAVSNCTQTVFTTVMESVFEDDVRDAFVNCMASASRHTETTFVDLGICLSDCPDMEPGSSFEDMKAIVACHRFCAFSTADMDCNVTVTTTTTTTTVTTTTTTTTNATTTTTTTTTSFTGCVNDMYEPNDSPPGEVTMVGGGDSSISAVICDGEDDWFAIPVCNGTIIIKVLFDHQTGDLDMDLYDDGGSPLTYSASATDNEWIVFSHEGANSTVFLDVYGYEGASAPYTMQTTLLCGELSCLTDDYEPNDSQLAAANLGNETTQALATACSGNDDYYEVAVCPGGALFVSLWFNGDDSDLDFIIYDEFGTEVASAETEGWPETAALFNTNATEATYYILVFGFAGSEAPYQLDVTVNCDPDCTSDDFEPNNSPSNPTVIGSNDAFNATVCYGEEDWYAFFPCANGFASIDVYFEDAVGDLDVVLFDFEGTILDVSDTSTDNEHVESVTYPGEGPPMFALVVGAPGDSAPYEFIISTTC
ncbi:hypothetical protein PTSG_06700 [Salpingoeca rosetta]|uniref:Peptidase C-terminal archaeal/bacterial domain-containing protein n=1 Tax=Salpingoeca rosetta (strain ATCC 50818 / BSB-021) TaxID=946362 RepID=F2UEJ3_SALR5|nr:uncharacterized protein PTSG_06700 [Salpingoeca rosetta]EGD75043.1 hypothetical protein PTSG_06700 [Salpingoeca rosetta]|eukprot:XP_004992096.1 hypothetical protein PTSG_06700 [Salpingoeca rosetta]